MAGSTRGTSYLRERAQHMVVETISQDPAPSLNGAVIRMGPRAGVVPETLHD